MNPLDIIFRLRKAGKIRKESNLIKNSKYFDREYYLNTYPDVKEAEVDPAEHFLIFGGFEGRNPSEHFNSEFYLDNNPDVVKGKMNPLLHYILFGIKENRPVLPDVIENQPLNDAENREKTTIEPYDLLYKKHFDEIIKIEKSGFFNEAWYEFISPDVVNTGIDLVLHFILHGQKEGRYEAFFNFEKISHKNHYDQIKNKGYIEGEGGFDVENEQLKVLLCAHLAGKKVAGAENSYLDLVNAFKRNNIACVVCLPDYNESYINKLIPDVGKIYIVNYKLWNIVRHSDLMVDKISEIITDERIDLVYANTIVIREPLIAARRNNVPGIVHVREMIMADEYMVESIGLLKEDIRRMVLSRSDIVVANSPIVSEYFNLPGKTFILPNTINIEDFNISNTIKKDGKIRIGLISSNIPKKGIFDFIEIARLCRKFTENTEFLLIGPKRDFIDELTAGKHKNEPPENLKLINDINDPVAAVSKTNLVVNLSLFSESFGRTILEGMAAGRPVIAYDFGALSDLINNGVNGYLVPFRDKNAVVEKILMFVNNTNLIHKFGKEGREIAIKKYSREVFAQKTGEIIQNIQNVRKDICKTRKEETVSDVPHVKIGRSQVSVIVAGPYNDNFFESGLQSIIHQTLAPAEVLLTDDNTNSNILLNAQSVLENAGIPCKVLKNADFPATFYQWERGINEAKANYVWISEADSHADPEFIYELQNAIINNESVFGYCLTSTVDETENNISGNKIHEAKLDELRYKTGDAERSFSQIMDYLFQSNSLPAISACIFEKEALSEAVKNISRFRELGLLYLYTRMLSKGTFSFLSKQFVLFTKTREDNTKNTSSLNDYLKEFNNLKDYTIRNYPVDNELINRMILLIDSNIKSNPGVLKVNVAKTNEKNDSDIDQVVEGDKNIHLHIDQCTAMQKSIQISGWALSGNGIEMIDVYRNNKFLGKVRSGLKRPDLKKVFPHINDADTSGFSFFKILFTENTSDINKTSSISIRVTDKKGKIKTLEKKVNPISYEEDNITKTDKTQLSEDIGILTVKEEVKQNDVSVSVVIPTQNAGDEFDNLLRTLKNQKGFRDIELIIVDSGSSDDTVSVAKSFGAKVVEIKPEDFTHSYSRNLGAEQAVNDFLFFTVQDALPSSVFLFYQLYSRLKRTNLKVITCTETPRADCDLFFRLTNRNHYRFLDVINKDRLFTYQGTDEYEPLRKNAQLSDIGLFIDRELFLKYRYMLDYGEDLDLGMRLVKDGHTLYYAGTVKMIHSHNRPPFYFLRRGLVDSLYMKIRFKDYKFPGTRLDEVIWEIPLLYNQIVTLIENKLLKLDDFAGFDQLDCTDELETFYDQPTATVENLIVSDLVDRETYDFISQLNEQSEPPSSLNKTPKYIARGVINYYHKLNNYVIDYYSSYSKETIADYANALLRIFAMLTGAYLGYCYLNEPTNTEAKKIFDQLRKNV